MSSKSGAIAVCAIWISTALAVSVGIYVSKNPKCLWFMLIPLFMRVSTRSEGTESEDKESE